METSTEWVIRGRRVITRRTGPPLVRDPLEVLDRLGMVPDPWQVEYLNSQSSIRILFSCRQAGKTEMTALGAVLACASSENVYSPIIAPSLRQASILARRAHQIIRRIAETGRRLRAMPVPQARYSPLHIVFENGSRLQALPASECAARGETATGIVTIDEASQVPDDVYAAVMPQRTMTMAPLCMLSTPWYQAGRFFEMWTDSELADCERWRVIAPIEYARRRGVGIAGLETCGLPKDIAPDIEPYELTRMTYEGFCAATAGMTQEEIRREMYGIFSDNAGYAIFGASLIRDAITHDVKPLFESPAGPEDEPEAEDVDRRITPLFGM